MSNMQRDAEGSPFRYGGRTFTLDEVESIRTVTEDPWNESRSDIARAVCAALNWVRRDGQPNISACGIALRRMEADGVIWLPLPTKEPFGRRRERTTASDPHEPITGCRGDLKDLHLTVVQPGSPQARLWHEFMERYHYLANGTMAGDQLRYLCCDGDRVLAALGFGSAALRLGARDRLIGWTDEERKAYLHLASRRRARRKRRARPAVSTWRGPSFTCIVAGPDPDHGTSAFAATPVDRWVKPAKRAPAGGVTLAATCTTHTAPETRTLQCATYSPGKPAWSIERRHQAAAATGPALGRTVAVAL